MKRTWRQVRKPDGSSELVEITPSASLSEDLCFDSPFISPVDGSEIRNKAQLHDHNRRNNVMQILPGVAQDVEQARKDNVDRITGREGKRQRIEALVRAYETHRR